MVSTKITVRRLSSFTLLKIMFITMLFPLVIIDTGVILFHLLSGDFVVNVTQTIAGEKVKEAIPIGKFILMSYLLIALVSALFTLILWVPCAASLWLWSKFRPLEIKYYENNQKEI